MQKIFKFHIYKAHIEQLLLPQDHSAHLDFALYVLVRLKFDKYWISHILRTDMVYFQLNSVMYVQNCRLGGSTNLHAVQ